jgi:hypothetical protein
MNSMLARDQSHVGNEIKHGQGNHTLGKRSIAFSHESNRISACMAMKSAKEKGKEVR